VLTAVLASGKVEEDEHQLLDTFFSQFVKILDSKTITSPPVLKESSIMGLCAVCPEILFDGRSFCLTGESTRYSRREFTERLEAVGARVVNGVIKSLDYLIVGADGNPCWAYACYGRKVERAVELRKSGQSLLIIHENDLHDALADL
jgi:NAD-dependent DNA ligase